MLAELGVLVAVGVLFLVLQPELGQSQVELTVGAQFVVDVLAVRRRTLYCAWIVDRKRRGKKTFYEPDFGESACFSQVNPAMAALMR